MVQLAAPSPASVIESFTTYQSLLFSIAYRMLGRVTEAEDMVQETWLRWQKQDAAAMDSPRAWLISAVTRLCIDQLRSARREREKYYGVWLPEPVIDDRAQAPDQASALADSLSMAFMMMLETLPPAERAVFLLREVFDYEYVSIASIVEKSESACRQIVHRVKGRLADSSTVSKPPTAQARRLAEKFLEATLSGEMQDLLALLRDDATLYADGGGRVHAVGRPLLSADRIARFFIGIRRYRAAEEVELRFTTLNGRPGALMLSGGRIFNAVSFACEGDRISTIYIVRNPDKLQHLQLEISPLPPS